MLNLDARHMTCTALQCCEYDTEGTGPVTYDGNPVSNFWDEVTARGESHVYDCPGIYPIGSRPDGSARYPDSPVCRFGTRPGDGL